MYVYIIYIGGSIALSIIFFLNSKKEIKQTSFFRLLRKNFFCKVYMKIVLFFDGNIIL